MARETLRALAATAPDTLLRRLGMAGNGMVAGAPLVYWKICVSFSRGMKGLPESAENTVPGVRIYGRSN